MHSSLSSLSPFPVLDSNSLPGFLHCFPHVFVLSQRSSTALSNESDPLDIQLPTSETIQPSSFAGRRVPSHLPRRHSRATGRLLALDKIRPWKDAVLSFPSSRSARSPAEWVLFRNASSSGYGMTSTAPFSAKSFLFFSFPTL